MSDQLLVNIIRVPSVGNLAPGAAVTLPHGLKYAGKGVVPNQYLPWQATNIIVNSATDSDVTFQNTDAAPQFAFFRVEFDHSIHAVGAGPLYWRGVSATGMPVAAVYGQFYSLLDQPVADGLATSLVTLEVGSGVGVSVVDPGTGPTQITVAAAGVYAFSISPQLFKSAGMGHAAVNFWPRKNGIAVPDSASYIAVTNNEYALPFLEVILPMGAGDYIEWVMNSDKINVTLEHEPAAVGPAAPSVICGVKRVGV